MAEEKSFFDDWLSSQKGLLNNWMDLTKKFQDNLMGMNWAGGEKTQPMQEVYNFYNSWIRTVGTFFDDMMKSYPIGVGRDTFSRVFGGADAYMKLYDFWNSLYGALRGRAFNMEAYQDIFDSSKYKEIVDKVFGFGQPQTMTEFFGQASKLIETWGTSVHRFVNPWVDALQKNMDSFSEAQKDHPEAVMGAFHNMFDAFSLTFGKALKMPKVGKDREKIELMMASLDKTSVYMAKNTEFQYRLYVTGENAMKKVVQAIVDKVKSGDEIKHYDEFFKIWTDINEEEFFQLFQSEDFSKLQSVLLDSALDTRRHIQKLMELYLEDFPIALRSEMNDLYKTIYDLKRKVRGLEKKLNVTPSVKEVTV
jgi:class III poly(R)-hydroxyalkanoic acid synthase PhaE subunit